jgi:small subunit ribosomal protein S16
MIGSKVSEHLTDRIHSVRQSGANDETTTLQMGGSGGERYHPPLSIMKTKIRLSRFGAKKKPFYRIVVASSTSPRNGRFLEVIGSYDPKKGIEKAIVNKERISFWMVRGAQPTEIVKQILRKNESLKAA